MTNKLTTKRALLTSVMALFLCFTMLLGTTYAWFTDSVSTANNTITIGNLDMTVDYTLDGVTWKSLDGANDLFDGTWEPGHTEVVALRITNAGSLAIKYLAKLNVASEVIGKNVLGGDLVLSELLTVSLIQQATAAEIVAAFASENADYDSTALFCDTDEIDAQTLLKKGDVAYLIVKVDMATTVGNEANHNGKDLPAINFGINVFATQFTSEEDSFGADYDADADFVTYFTSGVHTLNATLIATSATDVVTATGADTVVTITGGYYDAADQDCAVWAYDGATVIIEGGEFYHNGLAEDATPANHIDLIYAGSNGGKIIVKGGFFASRGKNIWILNEKDNQGEIVVCGGTFVNWNPADNVSEGANTNFLADGYYVVSETKANGDVWYTVVEAGANDVFATPADVQDVINNAAAGTNVILLAGEYDNIVAKSNITITGSHGAVVGCLNLSGAENVTIKGVTFDAANAGVARDGEGTGKQYANLISGGTEKNIVGARNIVIDGCYFTGTFANGGTSIAFTDQKRPSGFSGNITIKNCVFDTVNAYYNIYGYYTGSSNSGHGNFVIENNTFKTVFTQGGAIYLGRYASSTPVVVTGNTFEVAASLNEAMGIQAHSNSYTVSINASNNTFAN